MILRNFLRSVLPSVVAAFLSLVAVPAWAHVELDAPNGGESPAVGSILSIRWRPAVATHDTLNWDLWYSTVANNGPWNSIAQDLPAGDLTIGSPHSYAWTVPNVVDSSVWVRVRQDNNLDPDYEDVSANSFAIVAAAGITGDYNHDDIVDAADYTVWRKAFGNPNTGLDADGNNNGQIDLGDYTTWKLHYGEALPGVGSLGVVPEPRSLILLALAAIALGHANLRTIRSWR